MWSPWAGSLWGWWSVERGVVLMSSIVWKRPCSPPSPCRYKPSRTHWRTTGPPASCSTKRWNASALCQNLASCQLGVKTHTKTKEFVRLECYGAEGRLCVVCVFRWSWIQIQASLLLWTQRVKGTEDGRNCRIIWSSSSDRLPWRVPITSSSLRSSCIQRALKKETHSDENWSLYSIWPGSD